MKYCPNCKADYTDNLVVCPRDGEPLLGRSPMVQNSEPDDPLIGITIAEKYSIDRLIGKGGMGAVYEGRHLLLDRPVAIKVLHKNMSADERAAARFIREAKASAKIEHPNAVTIHDFGLLADGSAYLVMEFIRGESLRHILMQKGKVSLEQAIDWITQVCNVVEAAHQQGIIHRDLKPENVMLKESPDGSSMVKVVDFGLAKLVSSGTEHMPNLTQTGEVLGTPHYMAPEYYEGEEIDKRADIYAIGIIFYELLTGVTPFYGSMQSIIGGHLFKDPKPLFEEDPNIDPHINEIVQMALRKKRDERTSSASDFAQNLKSIATTNRLFSEQRPSLPDKTVKVTESLLRHPSAPIDPLPSKLTAPDANVESSSIGQTRQVGTWGETRNSVQVETRKTVPVSTTPYETLTVSENRPPATVTGKIEGYKATQNVPNLAPINYKTENIAKPTAKIAEEEEPESFFEIIKVMKRELAIGSAVITLLAIALVAFIIYRSQFSQEIRVKPLPAAQDGSSAN